jgi:hypothetical protein
MFTEIAPGVGQTGLRLHRQHDGKLNHHQTNLAPWVTQDELKRVVMIS